MVDINTRPENAENIHFATEGGIWFIPKGEVVEYGPTAPLPASAVFIGIIDESGITESHNQSTTIHYGFQGGRAYRTTVDTATTLLKVKALEGNSEVLDKFLASKVNTTTGGRHYNGRNLGEDFQAVVVALDPKFNTQVRQWFPNVQLTARGDRVFTYKNATMFDMTLTAYPAFVEGVPTDFVEWNEAEIVAS